MALLLLQRFQFELHAFLSVLAFPPFHILYFHFFLSNSLNYLMKLLHIIQFINSWFFWNTSIQFWFNVTPSRCLLLQVLTSSNPLTSLKSVLGLRSPQGPPSSPVLRHLHILHHHILLHHHLALHLHTLLHHHLALHHHTLHHHHLVLHHPRHLHLHHQAILLPLRKTSPLLSTWHPSMKFHLERQTPNAWTCQCVSPALTTFSTTSTWTARTVGAEFCVRCPAIQKPSLHCRTWSVVRLGKCTAGINESLSEILWFLACFIVNWMFTFKFLLFHLTSTASYGFTDVYLYLFLMPLVFIYLCEPNSRP